MSLIARRIGFVLAGAAVVACGAKHDDARDVAPGGEPQITLRVENHNFNDATVDAFGAAGRQRLGRVAGNGRESFTIRWTSPDIGLRITFLSGGELQTRSMPVAAGDVLELIIEQAIGNQPLLRRIR
jgi:hypothetical protein